MPEFPVTVVVPLGSVISIDYEQSIERNTIDDSRLKKVAGYKSVLRDIVVRKKWMDSLTCKSRTVKLYKPPPIKLLDRIKIGNDIGLVVEISHSIDDNNTTLRVIGEMN